MLRNSAVAAALVLVAGAANAFATVGGQTYIIDVKASSAGEVKARVQFIDDGLGPGDAGTVGIDIEDAGDYSGQYNANIGTVVTSYSVTAVAPDDGFFTQFSGVAIDLKQSGGIIGTLANALGIPGTTLGTGFSTSGNLFFYTGEELLD
jgi:hypothetical protein